MIKPGDIISYVEMCKNENTTLQHGMNFRIKGGSSIILMSLRPNARYADRIEESGKVLIYEGHDQPRTRNGPDPKTVDQPMRNPGGGLTRNGLFFEAAKRAETGQIPEQIKVYEKIRAGIWSYNGIFQLISAWIECIDGRSVFKFKLTISENDSTSNPDTSALPHERIIPSHVKLAVWKRDGGKCIQCGSKDNLHFDHILPFSKGGSSLISENIQLLCARHNLAKRDKIE